MPKSIDLKNKHFGRLLVKSRVGTNNLGKSTWLCQCDCGNETTVVAGSLRTGNTRSCGCGEVERRKEYVQSLTTHHDTHTVEYYSYSGAKQRCNNPNHPKYPDYGGRGIQFKFSSYEEFLAEVGRKPTSKHSIDRKDNDGHYEKGNVHWATRKQQANNKRNNVAKTNPQSS